MRNQSRRLLILGAVSVVVLAFAGGSMAAPPLGPVDVNAFNQVVGQVSNQVNNIVFTIPAGRRLVIEYVSAKGTVPPGDSVSGIHINLPIVHFLVVVSQGTDVFGKGVFTAAQSLHTAVGPFSAPTNVVVRMERNMFGPGNEAALAVTLAGQLVDP